MRLENQHAVVDKLVISKGEDLTVHQYKDDVPFNKPVVILGTKKQFVPNEELREAIGLLDKDLEEYLTKVKEYDSSHLLLTVTDITAFTLRLHEGENKLIFKFFQPKTEETIYFSLALPQENINASDRLAFLSFCTQIEVPGKFALRNPESINFSIFEYWTKFVNSVSSKRGATDIVYKDKLETFNIVDEEFNEVTIEAFPIARFSQVERRRAGRDMEVVSNNYNSKIPDIFNCISGLQAQAKDIFPGIDFLLHSYRFGPETESGVHQARIILNTKDLKFGGEVYKPSIAIKTDWSCKKGTADFEVDFGFWREICTNGAGMALEETAEESFVEEYLACWQHANEEKRSENIEVYQTAFNRVKNIFYKVGRQGAIKIKAERMHDFDFTEYLNIFLFLISKFDSIFEPLNKELKDIDVPILCETIDKVKGPISGEIIRYLLFQIISEDELKLPFEERTIKTPMDCINFITFFAKSYSADIQSTAEAHAMGLGVTLFEILLCDKVLKNNIYNKIRALVKV